jgi:hypothetical protein
MWKNNIVNGIWDLVEKGDADINAIIMEIWQKSANLMMC